MPCLKCWDFSQLWSSVIFRNVYNFRAFWSEVYVDVSEGCVVLKRVGNQWVMIISWVCFVVENY